MRTKQTKSKVVKCALLNRRQMQVEALRNAVRTSQMLIAEVRYAYSQACEGDALLAMVLLPRIESAVNLSRKLNEITSCVTGKEGQ